MNETKIVKYLRKIIQAEKWDKLKDGTITDWEQWLDPTKLRDKSLNQFVKLLIRLEVLEDSPNNNNKFVLHTDSWQIAKDYLENNIDVVQELMLLYDFSPSKSKRTIQ